MNREIKFRVFEPLNKKMHYLDFALYKHDKFNQQNNWVLPTDRQCSAKDYTTMNLDSVHIMQYTGLKDKNNNKIYEGDIVQAVWYSHEEPECEAFGEVVFNNGWLSFCIWDESNKTMSEMNGQGYYTWEIEVLGNIYDNPELLQN